MNNESGSATTHLARIEQLLEALVRLQITPILQAELVDAKMKTLYEKTGSTPIKDLATQLGFSTGKISGIWQKWEDLGIIRKHGAQYRKVL